MRIRNVEFGIEKKFFFRFSMSVISLTMKLNEDLSGRIENAQPIIDGVGTKTLQWSVFLDISKEP
mgnify:CR=1 FL=1